MNTPTNTGTNHLKFLEAWFIFFMLSFMLAGLFSFLAAWLTGGLMMQLGMYRHINPVVWLILGMFMGMAASFITYKWTVKRYIITQLTGDVAR